MEEEEVEARRVEILGEEAEVGSDGGREGESERKGGTPLLGLILLARRRSGETRPGETASALGGVSVLPYCVCLPPPSLSAPCPTCSFKSSSTTFISAWTRWILSLKFLHLVFISPYRFNTSPFFVDRSEIPFSRILRTRSQAGE
jgi:hypothetical protein